MTTLMPAARDTFVNPTATDLLSSATVPHAAQHDNLNDAMTAVEGIVVGPLVYNVKGYGAAVDGVTDDTAAIAAAYAACKLTGGVLYHPIGTSVFTSYPLIDTSHVSVQGAGMGLSRLLLSAGSTIPATGIIGVSSPATQIHNDVRDITVDANGQNGVTWAAAPSIGYVLGFINVGARSTVERVELVNRSGSAGPTGILAQGHDVMVQNCWVHDDAWTATTITSGAATAGAITVTPASITGFATAGQPVIFDPSVSVYGDVSGATGAKVVTPHPSDGKENPWPNGGITTGMLGIRAGQSLVIGGAVASITVTTPGTGYTSVPTVSIAAPPAGGRQALGQCFISGGAIVAFKVTDGGAGYTSAPAVSLSGGGGSGGVGTAVLTSAAETVSVASVTASTFTTGTTAVVHGATEPIYYVGTPELALIKTIVGSTFTITTQLNHANGVAILTQPLVYDGIAFDSANFGTQRGRGAKAIGNRCERLSLDGLGVGTFDEVSFIGNTVTQCNSGMTATNCNMLVVTDNTVDLTYAGVMPATAQFSCFFCLNIGTNVATTTVWISSVHTGNIFRGASFAIYYFSPGSVKCAGAQFSGNVCEGQQQHAIVAACIQAFSVTGNIIRNCNTQGLATSAIGLGGPCSAIYLYGTVSTQIVDSVQITGNTIIDDRATPLMVTALYGTGAFVTNVQFDHNTVKGNTGAAVSAATTTQGALKFRDNPGVNPLKLLSTTTTAVSSPAMTTTGSPVSATTYTNVSGVDIIMYVKTAGTTTVFTLDGITMGATFPVGAQFLWKAGSTFAITWSVQPVFVPYGL